MGNIKIHIPPFKTQGIKSKLVPLIKENVRIDNSTLWIEPFMGSGVVGLNVAPRKAVFADLNPHIICFYNRLKSRELNSCMVAEYLHEQGALLAERGGEHYYHVRDKFNTEHDPLDFLFLNRSCFNGMIRFNRHNEFNVPYGHKPRRFAKAYITKIVNQVRHFEKMLESNDWIFLCQSFEKTIAMADENSFVYCDPPYIGRHVDYYDNWDESREIALLKCLSKSGVRYMLSTWDFNRYRNNPYIDLIWGACNKITQEHFYFVGAKETNRNMIMEALLTNYSTREEANDIASEHTAYGQMSLVFD
ncbi:MAG: Dam family site-specific DNA-(adenine-N6)-methyltransferase [Synergistaceae bacterium]|jgi:DNA adenine methylase|nr:Dam family site-specific DNA-(adenine-N6)-methyltransferase [Synergistaceae bacterium]